MSTLSQISGRGDARPRDKSMATLLLSTVGSAAGSALGGPNGRARIGGQLIWATRFEEVATTTVERSGGRGGKSVGGSGKAVRTTYAYFANLAIALCEGRSASCGGCGRMGASST